MNKADSESTRERFEEEALPHLDVLLRAARKILRGQEEAEDIVQETYLRAWKYFASYREATDCRGWLFRVMFNVINTRKCKRDKIVECPLGDVEQSEWAETCSIGRELEEAIEKDEILEFTKCLPQGQRAVLWLVVVEEFSYSETARILSVPVGTVMSRLNRARLKLREQFQSASFTFSNERLNERIGNKREPACRMG